MSAMGVTHEVAFRTIPLSYRQSKCQIGLAMRRSGRLPVSIGPPPFDVANTCWGGYFGNLAPLHAFEISIFALHRAP
jgi:hypothetical protein